MRRAAALLFVASVLIGACGGNEDALSSAQREWCSFTNNSEEEALRFDAIFEAGLALELNMDFVNARASALRAEYEEQGMSANEAVRAVSQDLFEIDEFVQACEAAYAEYERAGG